MIKNVLDRIWDIKIEKKKELVEYLRETQGYRYKSKFYI